MDEKRTGTDEAELKRPEDSIPDLEPDEHEGDAVKGGAGTFLKLDGIDGESQDSPHKNEIG